VSGTKRQKKLRTHIFICQEYKRLHILVYTKKENTRDRMIECLTQKEEEKKQMQDIPYRNHFLLSNLFVKRKIHRDNYYRFNKIHRFD
jgi:hypothetical protein